MRIADKKYLAEYSTIIGNKIPQLIKAFDLSEVNGGFDYLTKASAVYSSNIEGNTIDLNSFMNYELSRKISTNKKEIQEIENLIKAYEYAHKNELTEKNMFFCHKTLSETLLIKSKRGKYRNFPVGVFGKSGLIYLSVEPEFIAREMEVFFEDILHLLREDITEEEVFYFAAFIHLRFVHIHPFRDGNGRLARLIEKWFIAKKLGEDFWKIPSEKYYKEHQQAYYENLNLGRNFYTLNYDKCLGFLEMLPKCLL